MLVDSFCCICPLWTLIHKEPTSFFVQTNNGIKWDARWIRQIFWMRSRTCFAVFQFSDVKSGLLVFGSTNGLYVQKIQETRWWRHTGAGIMCLHHSLTHWGEVFHKIEYFCRGFCVAPQASICDLSTSSETNITSQSSCVKWAYRGCDVER